MDAPGHIPDARVPLTDPSAHNVIVPDSRVENALIRGTRLTRTYQSGQHSLNVFADMDFSIARGERVALIGESGSGKTSLLYLLGGLDRPTSGTIYFDHRDISGFSDAELAEFRNREIGFVWQNHALLPEFSALENVMMPLLIRGIGTAQAAPVSLARLDEVGLRDRASHRAGELSGGEQQRVALARALVGDPRVLLADEPTGNLDFRTGEMIVNLLADLHRSHGLTSIYVTHNILFAKRCDRVLQLDRGNLVEWPIDSIADTGPAGTTASSTASLNYGGKYV